MSGQHLEPEIRARADGDTAPAIDERHCETLDDQIVASLDNLDGRLSAHSTVGEASRAVVETCEQYDVPLDPSDVTVVGVEGWSAPLSCAPYGTTLHMGRVGWGDTEWRVDDDPDGYIIFVEETNDLTEHTTAEAVRHEIAHCCGIETEHATYEQTRNHETWCARLDTW